MRYLQAADEPHFVQLQRSHFEFAKSREFSLSLKDFSFLKEKGFLTKDLRPQDFLPKEPIILYHNLSPLNLSPAPLAIPKASPFSQFALKFLLPRGFSLWDFCPKCLERSSKIVKEKALLGTPA